jgi:metal-sulfur cluster biosynthetic enzyme
MPSLFQRFLSLWKKPQPLTVAPVHNGMSEATTHPEQIERHLTPLQPLNEEAIYVALRSCYDPEIPLNIVDLGLIYDVRVADDLVSVKMTLTAQGCGMGTYIASEAEERIRALPGVREARVEIVWDPPWTPDMISPAGRQVLGLPE